MTCHNGSFKLFLLTALFAVSHILFGWQTTLAQNSQTETYFETLVQADAKMSAKQWTEAAALLEQIVRINPVEGKSWNRLARAYYNAKNYRKSIPAYEKQIELGY